MKILSNFDTSLYKKQIARAKKEFGDSAVLFVRRDFIYLVFKFYMPLVLLIIVSTLSIRGILSMSGSGLSLVRGTLWLLVGCGLVYFCRVSIGKFIDHYMDYMIITPEQITAYDQEGLLHRGANSLDTSKIKSISIQQNGLLCSIFNYGSIIFFAEGDVSASHVGQIKLNYIRAPRSCKKQISKIIAMGKAKKQEQKTEDSLQNHIDRVAVSPQENASTIAS